MSDTGHSVLFRGLRRALAPLVALALLVTGLAGVVVAQEREDRIGRIPQLLINELGKATGLQFDVARFEGNLLDTVTLTGIRVSDSKGLVATVDRLRFAWTPAGLFAGNIRINEVSIGTVTIVRAPTGEREDAAPVDLSFLEFSFDQPADIRVDRLAVEKVVLAPEAFGKPGSFSLAGRFLLPRDRSRLDLDLRLDRLSGTAPQGRIVARASGTDNHLLVDVDLRDEPGGLLAGALGLAPQEALVLRLHGDAPLDDWRGRLDLEAGRAARFEMSIAARTEDGDTRIDVDGRGSSRALDALMPRLGRDLRFRLAGEYGRRITLDTLELATALGGIHGSGWVEPAENRLDLSLDGRVDDMAVFAQLAGRPIAGRGSFVARLSGAAGAPAVDLDLHVREGRFDRLFADTAVIGVRLRPDGDGEVFGRGALILSVAAEGTRLDRFTGETEPLDVFFLDLEADVDPAAGTVRDARLEARVGEARLTATGVAETFSPLRLTADVAFRGSLPPELLYGAELEGAEIDASLRIDDADGVIEAGVRAEAAVLATGIPAIDAVLAGPVRLDMRARRAGEAVALDHLDFSSSVATLTGEGRLSASEDDRLRLVLSLERLARLSPLAGERLTGSARVETALWRGADGLQATAILSGDGVAVARARLGRIRAELDLHDLDIAPRGAVKMQLTGGELTGTVGARFTTGERRVAVEDIDARLNAGTVRGSATFVEPGEDGTVGGAEGRLTLALSNLRPLMRLAGADGGGALRGTIAFDRGRRGQGVRAALVGSTLTYRSGATTMSAESVRIEARAAAIDDPASFAGDIIATGVDLGGPTASRIGLNAVPEGGRSALTLSARMRVADRRLDLDARGLAGRSGADTLVTLQSLRARYDRQVFTLDEPAPVRVGRGRVAAGPIGIRAGDGRATMRLATGPGHIDARFEADRLPARILRLFDLSDFSEGTLSGRGHVRGSSAAPSVEFELSGRGLRRRGAAEGAGLDLDAEGSVTPRDGVAVRGSLTGGADDRFVFDIKAPPRAPIDAGLKGRFDLQALSDSGLLVNFRVQGTLVADLNLTGTGAAPEARGTLEIQNGRFIDATSGAVLQDVRLLVRGEGRRIVLAEGRATDGRGGRLTFGGGVEIDAARGYPLTVTAQAERMMLVRRDQIEAMVTGKVTVEGAREAGFRVGGAVTVNQGEIAVPDRLPPTVTVIDVVETNVPRDLRRDLARRPSPLPPPRIDLDLTIDVPRRLFVRGRGIMAELQGRLRVRGTAEDPRIVGALSTVRGHIDLLGRRFTFREGTVGFGSRDLSDPRIDFVAEAQTGDVRGIISVRGTAKQPVFTIESEPSLPQDEVLSRIMFGKDVGQLSAVEAIRLGTGAATLFGRGGGVGGLPERIRRATGLDMIDITADGDQPRAVFGKYVSDRVLVRIEQGLEADDTAAGVEVEVLRNLSIESRVTRDGSNRTGIKWSIDY